MASVNLFCPRYDSVLVYWHEQSQKAKAVSAVVRCDTYSNEPISIDGVAILGFKTNQYY